MLTTTQEIPTETVRCSAETIGAVTDSLSDFPCIVPTDSPVGWISQMASWSRTIVSIGVSLLGHVGVLAWLGYAPGAFLTRLIPVQEGHASIELTATMASTSQQVSHDEQPDAVQFEIADAQPTRSIEQPVPAFAAVSVHIQRSEDSDLPPVSRTTAPDAEVPCPTDLNVHRNRLAQERPPSEELTSTFDEELSVARTRVERVPTVKVLAEPVVRRASSDSQPSPASHAADGADSVPAVVHNPSPQYPSDALRARRTGRVVLRVAIATDGSVTEASVYRSSGVRSLDQAALEAVRKWRFETRQSASAPLRYAAVPIRFEIVESDTDAR